MNKKKLIILFIITFIVSISPFSVLADKKDDEKKIYCPLCIHRNDKDPMFAKERQFYQKVKILKKTYGDAIDEVVLAASVIHRYTGPDIAYEREYTENFDSNEYSNRSKLLTQSDLSPEEEEAVSQNEKYDLLTLAALVMADSNAGKYSDVCFKEGLSGNSLVGNVQKSSGIISRAIMPLIQGGTCAITMLSGTDSYYGDNKNVAQITEALRRENVYNVCNHGYVGGLYNGVKNIQNEDTRNAEKKVIAQQIIDYANYYKRLYGVLEEGETCIDNSAGATGSYANWKQTDSKWSNVMIGDEPDENVGKYGCLVTSMAIQISRSGSKIGSLPGGSNEFDPGSFAKSIKDNNGFDNGGSFLGSGYQSIAPNFNIAGDNSVNISDNATLASVISNELSSGYQDKYQKFIILCIRYVDKTGYASSQHWVAVNTVNGSQVTIFDPARNGTTLDENYESWTVYAYKVMYATDVSFQSNFVGSSPSSNIDASSFVNMEKDGFQHGDLPSDKVKYIVMHDTESGTDDANAIANAWGDGPVAAHFIVAKDGTIIQTVPINKIAHHAGWAPSGSNSSFGITQERDDMAGANTNGQDYAMNAWSIGIEIVHEHDGSAYPEEQLNAVDSLVSYLDKELGHSPEIIDHKYWTGDSAHTKTNADGQGKTDVDDSFPLSAYASSRNHTGQSLSPNTGSVTSCSSSSSGGGNDLNRFIGFLAYNEGHSTCNFQGRGENTGYSASTLAGDAGGQTTAFGITIYDKSRADEIGYNTFESELYSGCTEKANTEKLLLRTIDWFYNEWTKGRMDAIGVSSLQPHEQYAISSIYYGGLALGDPILEAIKTYGRDSNEVFEAFKNSYTAQFGGLARRRLTEYEMFLTGNYEAESTQYLGWDNLLSRGHSISKEEATSHFPTSRGELLEGMDFAPINGTSLSLSNIQGSNPNCELECNKGNASCKGENKNSIVARNSTGNGGIVECVHNQLGKPYVWAAEGPDSFDCSGLSKYCYKEGIGVELEHWSEAQYEDSRFVNVGSEAELVPGDLLVNHGHVAIYIGDGKMIHAPLPGDVVREGTVEGFINLGNSPVLRHYVG